MSKKIIFIMADSEAYLRDEVLRISKEWGFSKSNVKTVEDWNPAISRSSVSLFGELSMNHLDLSDGNKLKAFVSFLDDKKYKDYLSEEKWYGEALIITSTHARGTKKIETLVEKSGGKVQKKATPEEMKKILLSRLSLSNENLEFLSAYVGNDYQILVGIVNDLEKLDEEKQKNIGLEELAVRLPSKPGSLPPWEFINPMLEGNAEQAVKLYERSAEGSHVLVTMKLARTKLQLLYRLKLIQLSGVWKSQEQAKIIGERNGPNIWIPAKVAQKLDVSTVEYLAKLALKTEADLKGYSRVDPDTVFRTFLAQACLAIKHNKTLAL